MRCFKPITTALLLTTWLAGLAFAPCARADEAAAQAAQAVAAFHSALKAGDAKAAMQWLADDAQVLEDGDVQTREQYQSHHLAADMAFAKAVNTTYSHVVANANGNTAWVSASTSTTGTYQGRSVNLNGAELMVLTRAPLGWRIRAIHWSANSRKQSDSTPGAPALVGGDRDAHGCIASAGYSWCTRENACVRPWELAREKKLPEGFEAFQRHCESTTPKG